MEDDCGVEEAWKVKTARDIRRREQTNRTRLIIGELLWGCGTLRSRTE
jgi:hypothetical protein